jgi:hypothetical protein
MSGSKGKDSRSAWGSSKRDDVQDLANWLGRDLYIGLDGFLRTDKAETISANQRFEKDATRGTSGGCNQDPSSASGSGKSK